MKVNTHSFQASPPCFPNKKDLPNLSEEWNDVFLQTTVKKISELNFLEKVINKINNLFSNKKFIETSINGELCLVKIQDIAEKLGISKQSIIEADRTQQLTNLLNLAIEAKHHHVDYQIFTKARDADQLENLRYLGYLANSLHVPLSELLEAQNNGSLEKILQQAQKIENQGQEVIQKLDFLYEERDGAFVTKGPDERIQSTITKHEFDEIKKMVRLAFKSLARTPHSIQSTEMVIPISKSLSIIANSSGDSLKIIGLFGKLLGYGGVGVAVQRLNILEVSFERSEEAVLKIPNAADKDSQQILQEAKILDKIHHKGRVLGIQKKLRV